MEQPERYESNLGVLSDEDILQIQDITVTIVGLGGLGGNVANQLVRLGVKRWILIDFDRFSMSNLNRQLFSTIDVLGRRKVEVVSQELLRIDPTIVIELHASHVEELNNIETDYLIDCVDDPKTKRYLAHLASELHVPLLHGSCGGWYGQVGWILPGCTLLDDIYKNDQAGLEQTLRNPSFTPAVVASYMVSEFVKMVQKNPDTVVNELLLIDLFNNTLLLSGGDSNG